MVMQTFLRHKLIYSFSSLNCNIVQSFHNLNLTLEKSLYSSLKTSLIYAIFYLIMQTHFFSSMIKLTQYYVNCNEFEVSIAL